MTRLPAVKDSSPPNTLETLPGWEALSKKAQAIIEKSYRNFKSNVNQLNKSKIYTALDLLEMQEQMRPSKGLFDGFLKSQNLPRSTTKKQIKGIQQALDRCQGDTELLLLAAERNMNMIGDGKNLPLGVYTIPTKNLPPPRPDAPIEAKIIYLEEAERRKKKHKSKEERLKRTEAQAQREPRKLAQVCYQATMRALANLPVDGTNRQIKTHQIAFVEEFVGMVFTSLGISSPKMIEPQAVPDDFPIRPVGRPARPEEEDEE